ncbi:hypothetical protein [Hyalangium rubrum]|uniref:Glycosyltransferase RgtA/B/C/D-like domain-containing protein n=1 Tax=Hyalangium rubrum TaxID=3103134 RepID=A0ABU5H4G0_9BACT|nr:hypothetical protein [Hyalangium sp. s54d21]MDY7228365.1 hypothetical protein [Hyalangium sp. s54d21]
MKSPKGRAWGCVAVFVAVTIVYECCPIKGAGDLFWSLPTVFSIIREGNTDLNEYQAGFHHYAGAVEKIDGNYRNFFPMGSALVALGPIWAFNKAVNLVAPVARHIPKVGKGVANWQKNFERVGDIDASFFFTTEMVLASMLMGLAAVFIQLMASELLPWRWALVVTGAFAFCSSVWSTATRDMGQHGPSVLMLSIALWLLVRGRRVPGSVPWAGLFIGLSYVMRPTNSISVMLLSLLVLIRYRRYFLAYCAMGLLVAASFFLYNWSVYAAILPPYYRPERILPQSASLLLEALAGNLVSPGRGLFIYSPIFLLSFYGLYLSLRSTLFRVEAAVLGGILLLHWLIVSSFPHWWAGYSYGPRYMTDMTPYLCFLLIPVVEKLSAPSTEPVWKRGWVVAFVLLSGWSFFTHLRGSTSKEVVDWNGAPLDVDRHPERLWDFRDPAFLRTKNWRG